MSLCLAFTPLNIPWQMEFWHLAESVVFEQTDQTFNFPYINFSLNFAFVWVHLNRKSIEFIL